MRLWRISVVLVAVALLLEVLAATPSAGLGGQPDTPVVNVATAAPQFEISGSTFYVAHAKGLTVSRDAGATWETIQLDAAIINTPTLASPSLGKAYVAWERFSSSIPCLRELYFARTFNAGRSLSRPALISNPDSSCNVFPDIGANARGVVAVAWLEELPTGGRRVVVRRSTNRGAQWGPVVKISTGVPSDRPPSVLVRSGGDVVITFIRSSGPLAAQGIYVSTWGLREEVPAAPRLAIPTGSAGSHDLESGPNGDIWLAYGSTSDLSGSLDLALSSDGGTTWSSHLVATSDVGERFAYPRVALGLSGGVFMWCDTASLHLFASRSPDGVAWSAAVQVDDIGGPVHCGNSHADWLDADGGHEGAVFRRHADNLLFGDFVLG